MKLILCFFLFFLPSNILSQCPENGIEFQNHCYVFFPTATEFPTAELNCQSMNGHLASTHDGFTNAVLASKSKNFLNATTEFWIGLNTLMMTGNWSWTDNTTLNFEQWGPSEPQNLSLSCAALTIQNGNWKADDCFQGKAYTCETSPIITTTIATSTPITIAPTTSTFSSPSYPAYMNCTVGWVYFEPTQSCYGHDGYDYRYRNWTYAEQYCESVGAHLPSLHSYDEARFLSTLTSFTCYAIWTGLTSYDNKVSWSWSDHSPIDYLPWASGYPRLNVSSCVYLRANEIRDDNCTEEWPTICKKPANLTVLPIPVTPSYPAYMNCTEGWVYFEPTQSCYGHDGYQNQYGNWSFGEQYCESVGGHLPSLHSYDEARFLTTAAQFYGAYLWSGLVSYDNEVSWKWSDHSPVDYLPWAYLFPNLNVSSCVALYRNAIYDVNCTDVNYFVCKKPITSIKLEY